jgi:hypothetical protein
MGSVARRNAGAEGERKFISYLFLTSELYGGEWSASCLGQDLPSGKDPPSTTHWIGWWVGITAGLDTEARGRSLSSDGDRSIVIESVLRHSTDWAASNIWSCPAFLQTLKLSSSEWIWTVTVTRMCLVLIFVLLLDTSRYKMRDARNIFFGKFEKRD